MTPAEGTTKSTSLLPAFFAHRGESFATEAGLCCSMKILGTWLLMACFTVLSFAQIPFLNKKDKDFKIHDPGAVVATLRSGSDVQRSQLATELGIMTPISTNTAAKSNSPCVNFDHVDERQVRLRAGAENEVIIAGSAECDSAYVIAFEKAPKSEWRYLSTVWLAARARPAEVSFAELVQPGVSEIVVHRETTRDGGNAQQENFVVLKLLHDRLVPVLDTVERLELTMPERVENNADNVMQTQQSTFRVMKADLKSGASTRILEKEVLKERKTELTRYRLWSWDPEMERFRSSPHDGSGFAPPAPQPAPPAAAAPPKVLNRKDSPRWRD